jgi:hypothetical protein
VRFNIYNTRLDGWSACRRYNLVNLLAMFVSEIYQRDGLCPASFANALFKRDLAAVGQCRWK